MRRIEGDAEEKTREEEENRRREKQVIVYLSNGWFVQILAVRKINVWSRDPPF